LYKLATQITARATPYLPDSTNVKMPIPICISPEEQRPEPIGQPHPMLDNPKPNPYATRALLQRSTSMRFLQACPLLPDTPKSPELTLTPGIHRQTLQPVRLNFSPESQADHAGDANVPIYGLMYGNRDALREAPRLIDNIAAIYCSPILQENIHHLLADHSLDATKTQQMARYLGIKEEIVYAYIRETYPKHWAQLGHKK